MIRTHKRLIATAATLAAWPPAWFSMFPCSRPPVPPTRWSKPPTPTTMSGPSAFAVRPWADWRARRGLGASESRRHALSCGMEFPKSADGPKVVILTADKVEIWFKAKKTHVFVTEKNALRR